MFGWLRKRRAPSAIPDALWQGTLARYPFLADRPDAEVARLRTLAAAFLDSKEFHGAQGFVTDEVTPEVAEVVREEISMGMAVYLAATIAGSFLPKVGLVLFACIPILYMLPGRIDPRLVEEAADSE